MWGDPELCEAIRQRQRLSIMTSVYQRGRVKTFVLLFWQKSELDYQVSDLYFRICKNILVFISLYYCSGKSQKWIIKLGAATGSGLHLDLCVYTNSFLTPPTRLCFMTNPKVPNMTNTAGKSSSISTNSFNPTNQIHQIKFQIFWFTSSSRLKCLNVGVAEFQEKLFFFLIFL